MAQQVNYNFSTDWFSRHIPVWEKIFNDLNPVSVLEIGSYEGRSTVWMMEKMQEGTIACVDIWQDEKVKDTFLSNINLAHGKSQVIPYIFNTSSSDFLAMTYNSRKKYDLVYVDGSHAANDVVSDAIGAFHVCRSGGVIIFDDYGGGELGGEPQDSPRIAIDAFLKCFKREIEVIHKDYQVAVRKK